MAITGTNIIDQLLDEVPGLGWKFIGTATSGGAVVTTTDPELNKGGSSDGNSQRFTQSFLYIPAETGQDQIHSITTISVSSATTTITTLGNYGSTTTDGQMYILAIHPDILRALINDGLELELTDITLPITPITDGDMQTSGVTNWTDTSAVSSKVTTAANVIHGLRAMRVANSGANGGTVSALHAVPRGRQVHVWAIGRADVGSAVLSVLDSSNNVLASNSHTEENFNYIYLDFTPSVEEIKFKLGGDGASDDTYWQAVGFYMTDANIIDLPSWVDTTFKIKAISRARFEGSTDATDVFTAASREEAALIKDVDWRDTHEDVSVHPHQLHLLKKNLVGEYPLYIFGQRPFSDFATLAADTDSLNIPLHVIVPRCKQLLSKRYEVFSDLRGDAEAQIVARTSARQTSNPPMQRIIRRVFG
jgi:hypothetical protein